MADQDQKASKRTVKVTSAHEVPAHTKLDTKPVSDTQTFKPSLRSEQEVTHHLFKAKAAKFLANMSYRKDNPDFRSMVHEHIYHTVDSFGRPQKYTAFVGGHCHEVTVKEMADGSLSVKCGPALKKETYKDRTGRPKTRYAPVKFFDKHHSEGEEDGGAWIVDDHVHPMEYGHMEVWTYAQMMARGGRAVAKMDDGLAQQREAITKANVSITE